MSERCAIRSIDESPSETIIEASLPSQCVSCIQKALDLGKAYASVQETETDIYARLEMYHDDPALSSITESKLDSMRAPNDSGERKAVIKLRLAEPLGSIKASTEYRTLNVSFDCPDN